MSEQIDWSKAPEGYPLWITDPDGIIMPGWHKEIEGKYVDMRGGFWNKSEGGFTVHKRPTSPSWSGEGLPPVGVVCEAKWGRTGWSRCVVFAHKPNANGGTDVLVDVDGDWTFFDKPSMFRPTRTPEQSAADEREAEVNGMLCYDALGGSRRGLAEALYDAGYRKT